jgi:hypothetical protein
MMAFDYESGAKLMEHSWIGNPFVGAVMKLMQTGGLWHKKPIVWCGDYYNEEGEEDYYNKVLDGNQIQPNESLSEDEQIKAVLVNHTTREYVLCSKMPSNEMGWRINPLPLLTALGNGRGGGDYNKDLPDADKVGIWARHILSIEYAVPEGYKELQVAFRESLETVARQSTNNMTIKCQSCGCADLEEWAIIRDGDRRMEKITYMCRVCHTTTTTDERPY